MSGIGTITVAELERKIQSGERVEMIDVRTPAEYEEMHVPGVKLFPLESLEGGKVRGELGNPDGPVYVFCLKGGRARQAAEKLSVLIPGCTVVEGGTQAWVEAGFNVERGKKTISLERQVRIAAGLLVVTGIMLGHFVASAWFLLAGFVGCGLIFAGITDTCGMGLLLARMPWNQSRGSASCCCSSR